MRAYCHESVLVFLHGASGGTGIMPPVSSPPILQPDDERALGFPQVVGFNVQIIEPTASQLLAIAAFRSKPVQRG